MVYVNFDGIRVEDCNGYCSDAPGDRSWAIGEVWAIDAVDFASYGGSAADRFMSRLRIAFAAPSLGGVETLLSQPRFTSHEGLSRGQREAMGIPDGFVRISVGIEDADDLIADFEQALR